MRLDEGWNQIQFNLADFTRRAYGVPCTFPATDAANSVSQRMMASVRLLALHLSWKAAQYHDHPHSQFQSIMNTSA